MGLTMWLLYVLIGVLSIAVYFIQRNLTYWKRRGIPYTEPHLLLGNMNGFRKTKIMSELFDDAYYKHKGTGPFCGFYFFQQPMAFILDTELAKTILIKNFSNFANRGIFHNERDDPLTGHLFALDGDKWHSLRKKLSPTFTSGKMRFMFPTVINVGEQFVDILSGLVDGTSTIEIKELCARYTTDVIGTCAFGIECNSLKDPNAEFRVMGRQAFQKTRHGNILMGFIQSFPKMARRLRMRQIEEGIHQFFMRIVRETVEYREKNNIKRNDFMDLLVELKNEKTFKTQDGEVLTGLTVEQVAAQAFVFFLAGFETSSTTMSFALYELAKHQDVQDKMREELNEVFKQNNGQFSYDCMKQLHYMDQVISETLRLYTIVPHLSRQAINEYIVPDNPKYVIEKGMSIIIPSVAFHHDSEIYPKPYDFDPDRFSPEMVQNRDPVEWLPFGDGPRNCIGLRFGMMQTRIGLAYLLKNFKFSVAKETKIPMKFDVLSFLLGAEGGIFLDVSKM